MSYLALHHLHVACAILSIALFALRAGLLLSGRGIPRLLHRLPHVNDTALLAAAIALAVWSGQYPLQQPWLTAKLCALAGYIGLGWQALRPGLAAARRLPWALAALACVAYIVAVALTKQVVPVF